MKYFIKTFNFGTTVIDVPVDTTIRDFKSAIYEKNKNIPHNQNNLIYQNQILQDDKLIGEYKCFDGSTLYLTFGSGDL